MMGMFLKKISAALLIIIGCTTHWSVLGSLQGQEQANEFEGGQFVSTQIVDIPLFTVDSIGRFTSDPAQDFRYSFPTIIELFRDREYVASLEIDQKTITAIADSIRELIQKIEKGKIPRNEWVEDCQKVENKIRRALAPAQVRTCVGNMMACEFYRLGPCAFAERIGLSESDIQNIRKRAMELIPELEKSVREIESRNLKAIFSCLDAKKADQLNEIPTSVTPLRRAVVSPLWLGLGAFEKGKWQIREDDGSIPIFLLSPGGYLKNSRGPGYTNKTSDELTIISAQGWNLQSDPGVKLLWNETLARQLELRREYSQQRVRLKEMKQNLPNGDQTIESDLDTLQSQHLKSMDELIAPIYKVLPPQAETQLKQAKLLSSIQRRGPEWAFSIRKAGEGLGLSFGKSDFELISAKAADLSSELKRECEKLHRHCVDVLFSDLIDHALDDKIDELNRPLQFGVRPLEMLIIHCYGYKRE